MAKFLKPVLALLVALQVNTVYTPVLFEIDDFFSRTIVKL